MTTKTVNLYTFDELSDAAKERARDWWRECEAQDFGGHGDLNEPIETAAKLLGISFKQHEVRLMSGKSRYESDIWWTLHVQGAGASFSGTYSYSKGSVKAVMAEFPQDIELHRIARELAEIQKKYKYQLSAVITSDTRGHFIEVETDEYRDDRADIDALTELFRDFCRWIYKYFADEYDYRMSDECVDDALKANEYTFTESGKRED